MNAHPPHPSFFELDRLALKAEPAELERILGSCPECLRHVNSVKQSLPIPAWVRDVSVPKPRSPWWSPMLLGAAGLATVSVALLVLRPLVQEPTDEVRAKGVPSVTVLIRHDSTIGPWDGTSPVKPGDSLQLQISPAGFRHVTVAVPSGSGKPEVLFQAAIAKEGSTLLPQSFRVDAVGTAEHLSVLLSKRPLRDDELSRPPSGSPGRDGVWSIELVIPKE